MTDATIQDDLEDEYETELSRLGSSKALYALTAGEMETGAVLAGLAESSAAAAETFEEWADDDLHDAHDELFEAAAETAREHVERIAGAAGDELGDAPEQVGDVLSVQDDPDARFGALLAWTMVVDRTLSQAVGFFVGNADSRGADLFRDLRADLDELRVAATERLDDADRGVVLAAANQVVEAAYDQYVQTLTELGVKVKPVC